MLRPMRLHSPLLILAMLSASCALTSGLDRDGLQIERMERAVLPMAEIALGSGQVRTAERLYRRLLDVDPTSVDACLGLSAAALMDGDAHAAARWGRAALDHAVLPAPRQAALLAHGRAALTAGLLEDARSSFAALADDEEASVEQSAWGWNGVGLTWLLAGDLKAAVIHLEKAVRAAPQEAVFGENLERALTLVDVSATPSG